MKKFIFSIITFMAIISCNKEIKIESQKQESQKLQTTPPEQAYPGIQGEMLKVLYNNKTIDVEKKAGRYIWLGDIAFDKSTFDSLKTLELKSSGQRTFANDAFHQWPFGYVNYTLAAGFSANEQTMINDAIQHWRNNSSLTFTQRTNQQNYILITPGSAGSGLYSDYIGMKGGQQIINLEAGHFITGNVIHEIGHTIGFYHEQSRTDRGNAINVFYDNVVPNTSNNIYQFQTYTEQGKPGSQIGNFDFGSIMLYGSYDFSDGIHPTITRLDGSVFFSQRNNLSAGDIETSDFIYGPPYARIELAPTSSYYNPNGQDFDEWGDVLIKLYSDAACTTPTNLTVNKTATIKYISQTLSNGSYYYDTPVTTYTLTAGSNSYAITQYHCFDDSYLGVSNNYQYNDYIIENGYRR